MYTNVILMVTIKCHFHTLGCILKLWVPAEEGAACQGLCPLPWGQQGLGPSMAPPAQPFPGAAVGKEP